MIRRLPALSFLAVFASTVPDRVAADDVVRMRGGLNAFFQKLARAERGERDAEGEAIRPRVVYYGGSITAGAGASRPDLCYRSLLTKRLRALYPKAKLVETNAALGGTGSWLGAFRLRRDVLDHGLPPDLVVVEFAVNDGGEPESRVLGALEGIVRQIRKRHAAADLLFVYTLVRGHLEEYRSGDLPSRIQWHERVAAHYDVPSVNVGRYVASKILAGELSMDAFAPDGVHPTDRGHALYLEALDSLVATCRAAAERSDPAAPAPLPAPISPRNLEGARMVSYERFPLEGAWKTGQDSPVANVPHLLVGDAPGATIVLRFRGAAAGYFDVIGPDTGDLEYAVDGGAWRKRSNWDIFCAGSCRAHARVLADDLDPEVEHAIRIRIAEALPAGSRGRFFRPAFFLIDGTPAVADPLAGLDPLARVEAIYAGMEPVRYAPPADRWTNLEQTKRRLAAGPSLRIVLLGDSIVNDTGASRFELLLQRAYPACRIENTTSVRGSTGCWWFKEEGRVRTWVLRHRPDLVMIGGISQRDDADSIREVVRQVRAEAPDCEFLLMTGAFGAMDPRTAFEWTPEVPSEGTGWRTRLKRLAADERCGFLDMTGPWGTYIRTSSKGLGWFKRDPIHANERGFQILGRIVAAFLGPD